MKARTAAAYIVFSALIAAPPVMAQTSIYRSNPFGMELEKIEAYRRDEHEYVLEVDRKPGSEIRRLYASRSEVRRWETAETRDGRKIEREYEGKVLVAFRLYEASGALLREETYRDGALQQKASYLYAGGIPTGVEVTDAEDKLLYRDEYRLSLRGSLREVRRTYADGAIGDTALLTAGAGGEERDTLSGVTVIIRYDAKARVAEKEQWLKDVLVSAESFIYRGEDGSLLESSESRPADKTAILRDYDGEGRLAAEKISVDGTQTERTDYLRDSEGRATEKRRRGPEGMEVWSYSYDAAGELAKEEYTLRGSLMKRTLYASKDERTEEFFREGEMFLRVFFFKEAKTKEQVFEDGIMVRERIYE